MSVVFAPTAGGSRTGTLTVNTNVGAGTAALSGAGIILGLSPSAIDFGKQTVGTSSVRSITVSNVSNATTVNIVAIAVNGQAMGDYAQTTTCGSSVAPGASCTIQVQFTPSKKGVRNASLSVTHDSLGSRSTVSLTGSGK